MEFEYSGSNSSPGTASNAPAGKRQDSGDTITPSSIRPGNHRRSSETVRKDGSAGPRKLTAEARELWGGYRGIEEYAREVFPVEEEANGKTWMRDKAVSM